MIPKRYQQSDKLIQWAFLFEEFRPLQTSTCALFWRSVVLTPLKLLGPTFVVCLLGFLVLVVLFPEWFPEGMRLTVGPAGVRARTLLLAWGAGIALLAAISIAWKLGFWTWLGGLCLPVEIEGGLVQKGMCPQRGCMGKLIETDAGRWECRRCKGVFLPHTEPSK